MTPWPTALALHRSEVGGWNPVLQTATCTLPTDAHGVDLTAFANYAPCDL